MVRALGFALLFGLLLVGLFAATWLGLGRAWTEKTTLAAGIVAVAGALACICAAAAARRLARRPFALRLVAAFLCLAAGVFAFASLGLFLHAASTTGMPEDSLGHLFFFLLTLAVGAAYSFAGLGAQLVLLPALPLILLFAALIARRPR